MDRSSNTFGIVSRNWRARFLIAVVVLQAVSVSFFIGDVFADIREEGLGRHIAFEACATFALFLGVLFAASFQAKPAPALLDLSRPLLENEEEAGDAMTRPSVHRRAHESSSPAEETRPKAPPNS